MMRFAVGDAMANGTLRHGGGLLGGSVYNRLICDLHADRNTRRFISSVDLAVKTQEMHTYFSSAAKYYLWNLLPTDSLKKEMVQLRKLPDLREALVMMHGYYLGEVDTLFKTRFFRERTAHLALDNAVKFGAHLEVSPFLLSLRQPLDDYDHVWYDFSPNYSTSPSNQNWAFGKVLIGNVKVGLVYKRCRGWESISLTAESAPPSKYGRWIDYLLDNYGHGKSVICGVSLPILGNGRITIHRIMWPIPNQIGRVRDESSPELMHVYTLLLSHRSLYVEIGGYGLNPRRDPQRIMAAVKDYLSALAH